RTARRLLRQPPDVLHQLVDLFRLELLLVGIHLLLGAVLGLADAVLDGLLELVVGPLLLERGGRHVGDLHFLALLRVALAGITVAGRALGGPGALGLGGAGGGGGEGEEAGGGQRDSGHLHGWVSVLFPKTGGRPRGWSSQGDKHWLLTQANPWQQFWFMVQLPPCGTQTALAKRLACCWPPGLALTVSRASRPPGLPVGLKMIMMSQLAPPA